MAGFDNLTNTFGEAFGEAFGLDFTQGSAAGTVVTLEELEGTTKRKITLTGRAVPYQGVEWEGEHKSKVTWYPGNPVATQQLLGPQEMSTIFQGMWKDRFMLDSGGAGAIQVVPGADIDTAEKAAILFDELRRSGKLLRVQWLSQVRAGILKIFRTDWDRPQDLRWRMEFEWQSLNDEEAPRAAIEPLPAPDLFNLLNFLEDILTLAPQLVNAFVAGIVSSINSIRDRVSNVFNILRVAGTLLNLPATIAGALKAAIGSLVRELTELIQRLGGRSNVTAPNDVSGPSISPTEPSRDVTGGGKPSSAATQELELEKWRRSMIRTAAALRVASQKAVSDQLDRLQPRTTKRITVMAETSLYKLARDEYGSADFANYLANTNGLTTANVPAGFQLRIPPRPFSAAVLPEVSGARKVGCPD